MANRYEDLLAAVPQQGTLYTSSGEILPFLDRPHQFQLGPDGLTPGDTFNVFFNDVASGQTVVDGTGIANVYSIPKLPPGDYTIKLVHIITGATQMFFISVKNLATWFAAYADVLNSMDADIDEMDAARSLATVTPKYIEDVYGKSLRQPRPSLFRAEDYRNLVRQLRPAYRHFGAHPYGLTQAVEGFTSVVPLIVPDAWRPHWILGDQIAENGDFQTRTRVATALYGPAGAVSSSPVPELSNLNRQSRIFVHPGVGTSLVSSGFRDPPKPQQITVTTQAASQFVTLTGLDEGGLAIAETVPDPSTSPTGGTYVSQKLFSKILTAQRTGPGVQIAAIGLADDRFVRVDSIGDYNRPGTSPTLAWRRLETDGNPSFSWGGGDLVEVKVVEPFQGYGLSLITRAKGIVALGNASQAFIGRVSPGQTITITKAINPTNNGTFVVTKVEQTIVFLSNPEAVDETTSFHWLVNTALTPFVGERVLHDVNRRAIAVGRRETSSSYNLDPVTGGLFQQFFDRLHLELDDRGVVHLRFGAATVTPAAAATAINAAFNADARYGASYNTIASAISGTEGDANSVILLTAPGGLSPTLGTRSRIKIHPGPADSSEYIFGLPRSSTHLTSTLAGYVLNCADASRMPDVLLADVAPFRRRYRVRIRGLRLLLSAYALMRNNVSGTQANVNMSPGYTFTSADIGGYLYLADGFQAINNGMHRIIAVAAGHAIIVHENAATGALFDDNGGFGTTGSATVWGPGEIHTVIDKTGNVLTLDPTEPAPAAWRIGAQVELVEETPYVADGSEGIGNLNVDVDVRYRPLHDFGDTITFVAGTTWRLTSSRGNFAGQVGASLIIEGCQNLVNNSPLAGFTITAVTSTTADFVNAVAVVENSSFEWHIDNPNAAVSDTITVAGATMPDGWQVTSSSTTVTTTNNDPVAVDISPGLLVPSRVVLHQSTNGTISFRNTFIDALQWRGLPLQATFWLQDHTAAGSTYTLDVCFDGTNFLTFATSTSIPASVLESIDGGTQFVGPLDPFQVTGRFFVPYDATTCIIRITRVPAAPAAGTISFERMVLQSPTGTGLAIGDNTVPRSQKRAKFGKLLYVWSVEGLTTEEKQFLGLPLDGSSVAAKPGHIDYVTNAHGYWDRIDVTEVDDTGLTPIRNNIRGVFDSIDWAGLEAASGLTNLEVVIGTPSRLSYARPTTVTHIGTEPLVMIDGGDGPGFARANLNQTSNHGGAYPQAPNTGGGSGARLSEVRITDTSFVNADGLITVIPAGALIPLPDDLDVNGVQPWEFTSATQIRVRPPYFNAASSYVLDYDILMRATTAPFALASGFNTPADYVWLIDFPRYLRHNIQESFVQRIEQAQFLANFKATLSERADTTQPATLEVDDGISLQTVLFSDWSFLDSKTIRINSATFNQNALYTITYTAKVPDVKAKAILTLEWRSGTSSVAITSNPWVTVKPNDIATPYFNPFAAPDVTQNQVQPWHQVRVTLSGVEDVRDVRLYGLGVKGAHLFGASAFGPGILTPGP